MTSMDFPSSPTNGTQTADGRYYFDSSVGTAGGWRSTPLPVGGLPAGSIMAWATNTPPANWLLADGSAVSRSVYSSLFAVIGTQYGVGDGSTTFTLPDLRGRVPVGKNAGTFGTLGATGGVESETHRHWTLTGHNSGDPATYYRTGSPNGVRTQTTARRTIAEGSYSANATTYEDATYDATTNNLQPYQVVNYIIKASAGWTAGDSELATRLGAVETANATTNKSGLVPIVPTSVTVGSGTATVATDGAITFSGCNYFDIVAAFSTTYPIYKVIFERVNAAGLDYVLQYVLVNNGTANGSNFTNQRVYAQSTSVGGGRTTGNNYGTLGYITDATCSSEMTIYRPAHTYFTTSQTTTSYVRIETGSYISNMELWHSTLADTASYNSIRFYSPSGNISGKVKIYGYR